MESKTCKCWEGVIFCSENVHGLLSTAQYVYQAFPAVTCKNVKIFPISDHAISVALAALFACWTMHKWKGGAKSLFVMFTPKEWFSFEGWRFISDAPLSLVQMFCVHHGESFLKASKSHILLTSCVSTSRGSCHLDSTWVSQDDHSAIWYCRRMLFLCVELYCTFTGWLQSIGA